MQGTKGLLRLVRNAALCLLILAGAGLTMQSANAQSVVYRTPYVWSGVYLGAPLAWGWYGPWLTRHYPINPYGYSYWRHFNYQPRYASFGAIAFSKSENSFSGAWGHNNRVSAEATANAACAKDDCQTAVWVQGGCAAVATVENGDNLGWAYYTDRATAQHYAINACRRSGGEVCQVRFWVCSY